jgi:hypothetical protein
MVEQDDREARTVTIRFAADTWKEIDAVGGFFFMKNRTVTAFVAPLSIDRSYRCPATRP